MVPSNPPRPRIHRLRVEDPEKAIDDPALALLAAAGWTVAGSFPAEERSGTETRHFLVLVLWPPATPAPRPDAPPWAEVARWVVLVATLVVLGVVAWLRVA